MTKPEVYLYQSRQEYPLRDQPNKDGMILKWLEKGELLLSDGVVSKETEYYTMDTIGYEIPGSEKPYRAVSTTIGEPIKGWIFEPGILPLYAGTRSGLPDLKRLTEWSAYLNHLNPAETNDRDQAWKFGCTHFSDNHGALADAAYLMFVRFCNSSAPYLLGQDAQKYRAFFEPLITPEMKLYAKENLTGF
jgi:hypothetical protein